MTVKELIVELQKQNPDLPVMVKTWMDGDISEVRRAYVGVDWGPIQVVILDEEEK